MVSAIIKSAQTAQTITKPSGVGAFANISCAPSGRGKRAQFFGQAGGNHRLKMCVTAFPRDKETCIWEQLSKSLDRSTRQSKISSRLSSLIDRNGGHVYKAQRNAAKGHQVEKKHLECSCDDRQPMKKHKLPTPTPSSGLSEEQ